MTGRRSWHWTDRARYIATVLGMFAAATIAAVSLELLVPGATWRDAAHIAYLWGSAAGAIVGLVVIAALLLSLTFAIADVVEEIAERVRASRKRGGEGDASGPGKARPPHRPTRHDLQLLDELERRSAERMAGPCPPAPPMSEEIKHELTLIRGGHAAELESRRIAAAIRHATFMDFRCRCGPNGVPLPVDGHWQHKVECPTMAGRS